MIRRGRLALVAALTAAASVWLLAGPAGAASPISYPDFSSVAGLKLNGTATQSGSLLQMTTPAPNEEASAYSTTPVDPTQSFSTSFELLMSNGSSPNPADGIAFLLQSESITAVSSSALGGAIGYQGITPSLAVEFDIYNGNPGDPGSSSSINSGDDHVGITENGDPSTYLACATVVSPPDAPCTASLPADVALYGQKVFAWVTYDAATNVISVFVSATSTEPATPTLTATVNLATLLGSTNPTFGGFSAATGSFDAEQDILNWQLSYPSPPPPPPPPPPSNTAAPVVSGTAEQGQTLSATTGTWSNTPTAFAYQWLQCDGSGSNCTAITGATANSYSPAVGDVGHTLRVTVTASNAGGSAATTSGQTGAVALPPAATPAAPVLGQTADVESVSGTVLIAAPGSATFTPLTATTAVPLGSTIDTSAGRVSLTVALPHGAFQTGQFYGGEFILTQSSDGTVVLTLTGGSFAGCPKPSKKGGARLAAATKKRATVVRQLWGNAHGKYTTKGRYGSAAVSGTIWLTQDRCDGTYVRVTKDNVIAVAYAHPKRRHNVKQGHHVLLLAPGF